ncbi:hypothetical protein [Pseudomonas sp. NKUCC02_KPG]|nr:hypothetical protein [Pseudomonas sp. NKUCC02_KPG]MBW3502953.1 hypothetical protein [Pseudomonas sp. NKUCC02_KPG]
MNKNDTAQKAAKTLRVKGISFLRWNRDGFSGAAAPCLCQRQKRQRVKEE